MCYLLSIWKKCNTFYIKNQICNSFFRLSGQEEQIGGFDLIYKGGPVKPPTNGSYQSFLGAFNNRNQQLKKMAKNIALRLNQEAQDSQLILQGKPASKESPVSSNDLFGKKTSIFKNTV